MLGIRIFETRKNVKAIMLLSVLLISTLVFVGSFGANAQRPKPEEPPLVYLKLIDLKERPVANVEISLFQSVDDRPYGMGGRTNQTGIAAFYVDEVQLRWGDYYNLTVHLPRMPTETITLNGTRPPVLISFTQPDQIITFKINTRIVSLNVFDAVEGSTPPICGLFYESYGKSELLSETIILGGRIQQIIPEGISFDFFVSSPLRYMMSVSIPETEDVVRDITLTRAVNMTVDAVDGNAVVTVSWMDVELEDRGTRSNPVPYALNLTLVSESGLMTSTKLGSFDLMKSVDTKTWMYNITEGWENSILKAEIYMDLSFNGREWEKIYEYQDPWVQILATDWRDVNGRSTYKTPLLTTFASFEAINLRKLVTVDIDQLESQIEDLTQRVSQSEATISQLREQLNQSQQRVSQSEATISQLREQLNQSQLLFYGSSGAAVVFLVLALALAMRKRKQQSYIPPLQTQLAS